MDFTAACPIPISDYPNVLMAHGGGGRLSGQLIANPLLGQQHDGAAFEINGQRLAFSTDSYVVKPMFFPGGNIGELAVYGTVNDLAMCGARPLYLSAGFIIEEGLPVETLWRIVQAMGRAAEVAGVQLVTGDTKVVDRGKGDGVFINTAGIGVIERPVTISPAQVQAGDAIIVSGDLGRHGMAIMSVREGLEFETTIESDCAPLAVPVHALLDAGVRVHCLRDLTRGGLSSALNEIAEASKTCMEVDEALIPVREQVRGACEILGFDPLYVANEGRFAAFVDPEDAQRAVEILRATAPGGNAVEIGNVTPGGERTRGRVTLKSSIGVPRILDMLTGEQLPRIC